MKGNCSLVEANVNTPTAVVTNTVGEIPLNTSVAAIVWKIRRNSVETIHKRSVQCVHAPFLSFQD